ncbi:MAG: hypothetical protein ACXWFJ_03780, partial [Candidatus Aminicenantales bacterium]
MRKAVFFVLLLPLVLPLGLISAQSVPPGGPAETPAAFVERLQGDLQGRDPAVYLEAFSPEIRASKQSRLSALFDDLKMTSVTLRMAGVKTAADGTRVFVQAFFGNDLSA